MLELGLVSSLERFLNLVFLTNLFGDIIYKSSETCDT